VPLTVSQLKRKLRQLRQLEMTLRFGQQQHPPSDHPQLVWDVFFSTKTSDRDPPSVKYPLAQLLQMEHDQLKVVVDDYFIRVYSQISPDQDLTQADVYDPQLLVLLGLPPSAGIAEIRQRFRAMAQRYHPDHGGDSEQFVELVAIYERLRHKTR
jgi:DnaJ domain